MTNKSEFHYTIDLAWPEKLRGYTYSGAAGTLAAATSMPLSKMVVFFIALPEFTTSVISLFAFAHFAHIGAEHWNKHVQPHHLIVRKTRAPKFKI